MLETGEGAAEIVEKRGLRQTSATPARSTRRSTKVLADNADKVEQYKGGKQQLFGFFVGQVMKAMGGKANPKVVNERLRSKLD
jgi:aspartyl-tRNA(Asn)/glutamyl-tRNA(Gln) amidotransferase subunit B